MDAKLLFARAQPSAIRIAEHYHYTVVADSLTGQGKPLRPKNAKDQAAGTLEVVVPYTGDSFPPEAVRDVEYQQPKLWSDRSTTAAATARIGYLSLDGIAAANLDQALTDQQSSTVVPLDVPVKTTALCGPQDLHNGRFACRITQTYTPRLPEIVPIAFTFKVWDEDEQQEIQTESSLKEVRYTLDTAALEKWLEEENEAQLATDLFELGQQLEASLELDGDEEEDEDEDEDDRHGDSRALVNGVVNAVHAAEVRNTQIPERAAELERQMIKGARQTFFQDPESVDQSLTFRFAVGLYLPAGTAQAGAGPHPVLKHMALHWPVPTSNARLHLTAASTAEQPEEPAAGGGTLPAPLDGEEIVYRLQPKPIPVRYSLRDGAIQWQNVALRRVPAGDSSGDRPIRAYATPEIVLVIDHPAELDHMAEPDKPVELVGQFEIVVPGALSGLAVQYFGADGKIRPIPQRMETLITCNFTLQLADYARQKWYTPYQYFQFDGVCLDELRVRDIVALLRDLGFRVDRQNWSDSAPDMDRWCILGTQNKGLEKLQIWVLAEGTHASTRRERRIPGGQTFTSDVATGHTTIYVRGDHRGSSKDLLNVMLDFQQRLKQEFGHVGTVD